MQQKTDKFVYFSKNKLCCDLLLSLCCCLLYSTLVFETISAKDAFVYSQTDQQIQEINISLDYCFRTLKIWYGVFNFPD